MLDEVLSQNEIDALLSAISTGEMTAEELKKDEEDKRIKVYDFKRALRFSKEQIRGVTRIYENYARLLTTYFSAQLRTYVDITVASADRIPYEEYIRSIPNMTILNVFEMSPLEGRMIMEVHPSIAYAMVDRVLGGRGTSLNKIDTLTEIETKLITNLFERTTDYLMEAWAGISTIDPVLSDLEVNPQFLQIVSPNETVVVISMNANVGEASGMMNICIPHMLLEPIIPKLSAHYWMESTSKQKLPDEIEAIEKKVKSASIEITAELGETQFMIEDFLSLAKDDIIELNHSIRQPITIKVSGIPKFIGQEGDRKSVV